MHGRQPLPRYHKGATPIKASDLNKLRGEITRLGKISVSAPLAMTNNATGTHISLAGPVGTLKFNFFLTAEQINPNASGKAHPNYIKDNGEWEFDTTEKKQETLYAPPTLTNLEYYPAGIVVTAAYHTEWQRWVILSSPYCTC